MHEQDDPSGTLSPQCIYDQLPVLPTKLVVSQLLVRQFPLPVPHICRPYIDHRMNTLYSQLILYIEMHCIWHS